MIIVHADLQSTNQAERFFRSSEQRTLHPVSSPGRNICCVLEGESAYFGQNLSNKCVSECHVDLFLAPAIRFGSLHKTVPKTTRQ